MKETANELQEKRQAKIMLENKKERILFEVCMVLLTFCMITAVANAFRINENSVDIRVMKVQMRMLETRFGIPATSEK